MRKYLIYIISLFLFINVVKAQSTLELNDSIIEFPSIENYSLQGFTTTDKNLFIVLNGYDDAKSMIMVYDLDTYRLVTSYDFDSLGHANDVTYNSKNNMIYVLSGGGSNLVYAFDGSTFQYIESFKIDLPARSITYIEDTNNYAIRTVATGFKLNSNFNLENKLPFIVGMNINNDIGRQGWAYYKGYIYYSNWSWVRLGGDGSNIIFIYDMNGKNVDVLYTKNDIGEVEDIAFYKEKMILGFNGYDNKIKFYYVDIPLIGANFVNKNNVEEEQIDEKINEENDMLFIGILLIIIFLGILSVIYLLKKNK